MAVLGISYDPVDVLATFSREHGITFPLLSDEGSGVIDALGLRDTRYDDRPPDDHHRGVPRPGTFLLDEDGHVVERRFEAHHRWRPSAPSLFEDVAGEHLEPAVSGTDAAGAVQVAAWLAAADYRPQEVARVGVSVAVEPGFHVYVPPVPAGYVALEIALDPLDGMVAAPADVPQGRPFRVEGLQEQFFVLDGTLHTTVPFRIERDIGPVELTVRVRAQACDETTCQAPVTLAVTLPVVPGEAFPGPQ